MKTENPVESIQKMELFNSAELRLGSMHCLYEFKLIEKRQGSIWGLMKEDSVLMGYISTGDVVPMNYKETAGRLSAAKWVAMMNPSRIWNLQTRIESLSSSLAPA